jgi:hypothetical protein
LQCVIAMQHSIVLRGVNSFRPQLTHRKNT